MGRYSPKGQELVYLLPAIASASAPTVAEFGAGHLISTSIKSIAGFSEGANDIDVSDMSSTFPKSIAGMETMTASSIVFHRGDTPSDPDETVGAYFVKGATGYIVFVPGGSAIATKKCEVWPVQIKSVSPDKSADSVGATRTVQFSNTGAPTYAATIAA